MPSLANNVLDWMGEHPVLTVVLFVLLFSGGCSVAIHVGIVDSSTKLMPY